ncbi:holo-ACP synthase [bacterium]|nr:holo-ACP synthase [bacterium]
MNILGLGVDIESCGRFKDRDEFFINRLFTKKEIEYCKSFKNSAEHFAGRFCAKEACIKALNDTSIPFRKMEILNSDDGMPNLVVDEEKYQKYKFLVSISHTNDYATATVIVTI